MFLLPDESVCCPAEKIVARDVNVAEIVKIAGNIIY